MRAALQKSAIPESKAFVVKNLQDPFFDPNWHFHPEYQLFVVLEGKGTRFVGDKISPFQPGDMVFTGPNLPHLWRSDEFYFDKRANLKTEGIVIYLQENFLGGALLQKEEMSQVNMLLEKSQKGLEYFGQTRQKVTSMMQELLELESTPSIIKLFEILDTLATSKEYHYITTLGYTNNHKETDTDRMNKVYAHVMNNFKQNISLEEVASMANMTPTSFSRYFKARANKPFSNFISEIRIGHACKLLLEGDSTVAQICFECGFKTLSNFNKQFKEITKLSPLKYKKEYQTVVGG